MNKLEADAKAREDAMNIHKSFIMRAPAGSGKTGLLIKRYLKLLSLADLPEEIIMITFTRKATAEIRARVLGFLERADNKEEPKDSHDQESIDYATSALERDREKGWHLIDCPDRLQIQTIDGFSYFINRQMPLLGNPNVKEDTRPEYEAAAGNTLFEDEESLRLFKNIILQWGNNLSMIKDSLAGMLGKRDQWLAKVLSECTQDEMQEDLARLIEFYLDRIVEKFPSQYKEETAELLRYAARNLVSDEKSDNPIAACISISEFPSSNIDNLIFFRGIKELLLTKEGDWRKTVNRNSGFPPSGKAEKKRTEDLIENLQGQVPLLPVSLRRVDTFPSDISLKEEWELIFLARKLFSQTAAELHYLFREQDVTDYTGVSLDVIGELEDENSQRDLALSLDSKIEHLLVDEVQDVSPSQYKLLRSLVCEWSEGDGRTIFLVGDPQQAIYGFRNAEVRFFLDTWEERSLGNVQLEQLILFQNYRSGPKLVEWCNEIFKIIFSEVNKIEDAIPFFPSFSEKEIESKVKYHALCVEDVEGKEDEQATKIIKLIKKIKKESKGEKIAVLVRTRFPLNTIIDNLVKEEIPYTGIGISRISQLSVIKDLTTLTRAFFFRADRIAWLSCLRAPWCGLKLKSLLMLCEGNKEKTVWQCICDNDLTNRLDEDEKKRLENFKLTMEEAISRKQRAPLRDVIEALWYQLGGPATLKEKHEFRQVSEYFSLLEEFDQGGTITDFQKFKEQLESHYISILSEDKNPVEIMTIHTAKGLEFDHVIVPALERRPLSTDSSLLTYDSNNESKLIGVKPKLYGNEKGSTYYFLKQINKLKEQNEARRLLYVSATRARKALHLIGRPEKNKELTVICDQCSELILERYIRRVRKCPYCDDSVRTQKAKLRTIDCEPASGSFLSYLWPVCGEDFTRQVLDTGDPPYSSKPPPQEISRLPSNWTLPGEVALPCWTPMVIEDEGENNKFIEFKWAGETIKNVGSVVHRTIQQIAEDGIENWTIERLKSEEQNFKKLLQEYLVPPDERGKAINYIFDALTNLLNDDRGQWILSKEHNDQHNEYRVSGVVSNRLIRRALDRTFLDKDGVRWIIDYKTSPHEGTDLDNFLDEQRQRYQPRLEEYAALMEGLGEKNIKLGLYFPLLTGWREWEYQSK